jgi:hypothetical protein
MSSWEGVSAFPGGRSRMTREPSESKPSQQGPLKGGNHDHTILLLQGGGALGAYQAGAVEGLAKAGIHPEWIVGISDHVVTPAPLVDYLVTRT